MSLQTGPDLRAFLIYGYKSSAHRSQASPRLKKYVDAVSELRAESLVSIILFGSAASGVFSAESSDVDLIIALPDSVTQEERDRFADAVSRLEIAHGFRAPRTRSKSALERLAERAGGHGHECFLCTRSDLAHSWTCWSNGGTIAARSLL